MTRRLIVIVGLVLIGTTSAAETISVKGSDTMVRLAQRWAEKYGESHPGVVIQISGGGSGTGIAAILNGGTDVCQASRDLSRKEYALAVERKIAIVRIPVALDGIAVYVNNTNTVHELSLTQLRAIFTGRITNWKDLGGLDHQIVLYGRENSSGTYALFDQLVLKKEDYSPQMQTLPGTASVVNAVAKDPFGIGYGGVAWEAGVKHIAVKRADSSAAVAPSLDAITNGKYPISRQLYWVFNGQPTGAAKELVNWVLSPEGQAIAGKTDYVPLPAETARSQMVK